MTPENVIALPVAYAPSKAASKGKPRNVIAVDFEDEDADAICASPGYEPPPIWGNLTDS